MKICINGVELSSNRCSSRCRQAEGRKLALHLVLLRSAGIQCIPSTATVQWQCAESPGRVFRRPSAGSARVTCARCDCVRAPRPCALSSGGSPRSLDRRLITTRDVKLSKPAWSRGQMWCSRSRSHTSPSRGLDNAKRTKSVCSVVTLDSSIKALILTHLFIAQRKILKLHIFLTDNQFMSTAVSVEYYMLNFAVSRFSFSFSPYSGLSWLQHQLQRVRGYYSKVLYKLLIYLLTYFSLIISDLPLVAGRPKRTGVKCFLAVAELFVRCCAVIIAVHGYH